MYYYWLKKPLTSISSEASIRLQFSILHIIYITIFLKIFDNNNDSDFC